MAESIDEIIHAVRRIATELRPGLLDTAGLLAAIEWQANQFQRQTGLQCRVKAAVKERLFDQDLNTAFFRIFQETLTNVIRHANASRVVVQLYEQDQRLVMKISDDGDGMPHGHDANGNSFGLVGIEERINALHGHFTIASAPGQGTTVMARLPLHGTSATRYGQEEASGA